MGRSNNDELQDILHDPNIGIDVADRKLKLAQAKKLVRIANIMSIGIAIWILIIPRPYNFAIITAIIFPIIPVCVFAKYKFVINLFNYDKRSIRPSLDFALTVLPACLSLRTLVDYNLLNYAFCIMPVCGAFIVVALIFYFILPKTKINSGKYDFLFLALLSLPYCYGTVVAMNCVYDNAEAVQYQTIVLSKYKAGGKTTTYYLDVGQWGPRITENDISIPRNQYDEIKPGQTVTVSLRAGLLHIPWFYIQQ